MENFWKEKKDWLNKLTLEDAKFIFDQAEKSYNYTMETAKGIYERSNGLLTLVSGVLIGLVAYAIGKWKDTPHLDTLLFTAIVGIFYFLILGLIFILESVTPSEYLLPGTNPEAYFNIGFFNDRLKDDDRLLAFYKVEIINFKERIEENTKKNDRRWKMYVLCLRAIFFSPIVMGIAFGIANIAS
ncbi:hypothetical protein [Mucilaginibacter kameinonensis]|uniref:hypothetical protein n=1 Tax=Mucilaginibacter kameinonensis TaxID=452286 RepID=UPI000EF7FC85|nr:hypothetical protein [Mucilaginibacter kameinonensis]